MTRKILGWLAAPFLMYKRHWMAATGWDGRKERVRRLGYLGLVILWNHLFGLVLFLVLWGFVAVFREFLQ